MIARESFEKSFPRLASAAPFLCLIDDHLLCPDTFSLPYRFQKELVDARVVRQLGVERRDEDSAVASEHRPALVLSDHVDPCACGLDPRGADEDPAERLRLARKIEVGLEARDL